MHCSERQQRRLEDERVGVETTRYASSAGSTLAFELVESKSVN
jgi:hypothetical protein